MGRHARDRLNGHKGGGQHLWWEEATGDENALQLIVDATNAKGGELVVKELPRGKFRAPTPEELSEALLDLDSGFSNVAPGTHARYRCPELVSNPLTVSELLVFLGCHVLLGVKNNDVLDHAWCTSKHASTLREPLVADSIKEDRYKTILAHLSFLKGDDERWLNDPVHARLRKFKPVDDAVRRACQDAWDVEPDAVPDESRLRMSRCCGLGLGNRSRADASRALPRPHQLTSACVCTAGTAR